jgi:hypothetical protein
MHCLDISVRTRWPTDKQSYQTGPCETVRRALTEKTLHGATSLRLKALIIMLGARKTVARKPQLTKFEPTLAGSGFRRSVAASSLMGRGA